MNDFSDRSDRSERAVRIERGDRAERGATPRAVRAPLRLTLRQLAAFVAVAEDGSTRGASDRMARSQSATSSALAALESALGARLFDRVGRRLVLNDAGRALLPRAGELLAQAEALQAGLAAGAPAAPLRVAASFTIGEYLLPGRIARWTLAHPDRPVRLRIGNTADVLAAVAAFDADVGFVEGPQTHPDVAVRRWLDDELVVVAAATHPLARAVATRRQLAEARWALREPGSGTRLVADDWLSRHLPAVHVAFELGSAEAIKRVVAEGAALGCLSRHALTEPPSREGLAIVRTALPAMRRRLGIAMHRQRPVGDAAARFLAHCDTTRAGPR